MRLLLTLALLFAANHAGATAPSASTRPEARPITVAAAVLPQAPPMLMQGAGWPVSAAGAPRCAEVGPAAAVDEIAPGVFVHLGHITCVEPNVAVGISTKHIGGFLGHVPVAFHHLRPFDANFANFALGKVFASF